MKLISFTMSVKVFFFYESNEVILVINHSNVHFMVFMAWVTEAKEGVPIGRTYVVCILYMC